MVNHSLLPRKLSSGIYGKMEFDFACNRGHGFGEAYLHGLLIEILSSNVNPRTEDIRPSFPVTAIQRSDVAAGRKREVDVAVTPRGDNSKILTCIEAKWAGSSHATEDRVTIDLARLALISEANPDATCLFVLAGGKSAVSRLLAKGVLAGGTATGGSRLLRYPYDGTHNKFVLNNIRGAHTALPRALRTKITPALPMIPDVVRTYLYKPAHEDPPDWGVGVWRVTTRRL